MYIGLDMARRKGITHLHVESDSKVLVNIVTGNCNIHGGTPTLVQRNRTIKNMD
jgi:ribonuclease HI